MKNIKKKSIIFIVIIGLLFLVAGCNKSNNNANQNGFISTSFVGGNQAVTTLFSQGSPPNIIQDNGLRPFNIKIKVINMGEYNVPADKAVLKLGNIDPKEFNLSTTLKVLPKLIGTHKQGKEVIQPIPYYVYFNNLKFNENIISGEQQRTIYTYLCYPYETRAITLTCVSPNPIQSIGAAVKNCNVQENKKVSNSGAPIWVANVKESASGSHSVRLEFDIINKGENNNLIFEPDSIDNKCDIHGISLTNVGVLAYKNRLRYIVGNNTNLNINCEATGNNSNLIELSNNQYHVTCEINTKNQIERNVPILIILKYDVVTIGKKTITIEHVQK